MRTATLHLRSHSEPTNTRCLCCGSDRTLGCSVFEASKHIHFKTAGVEYHPCKRSPSVAATEPPSDAGQGAPVRNAPTDSDPGARTSQGSGNLGEVAAIRAPRLFASKVTA